MADVTEIITTPLEMVSAVPYSNNTVPTIGRINQYDASGAARTPTLPALSGIRVGARLAVQKRDGTANTVTFTCAGSDVFADDGGTTLTLRRNGEQRELQVVDWNGTKRWKVIGGSAPSASYSVAFPEATTIAYNGDGSVASVTENGVAITYTYNSDGTVHTDTRLGVTRTYSYDGSGNLTGIAS